MTKAVGPNEEDMNEWIPIDASAPADSERHSTALNINGGIRSSQTWIITFKFTKVHYKVGVTIVRVTKW